MRRVIPVLALFLCTACYAVAPDTERPRCNKRMRGKLWPERANTDRDYARQAERCGELMICTSYQYRYRWEQLTVHYNKLAGSPVPAPGCGNVEKQASVATTLE